MSRLTKNLREQMARKLVNHRYQEEAKALIATGRELFDRAHSHFYTPALLRAMGVVNDIQAGTFGGRDGMDVNARGYSVTLGGTFYSRWVKVPQEEQPEKLLLGHYYRHNIVDDDLSEAIQEYVTRKSSFEDTCKEAYYEAMSVLNTISSGKKLADAWPEALPVIGDLIPESQRTLPVVQLSTVNAKFKLPPENADG